jgi:hypothetical protein
MDESFIVEYIRLASYSVVVLVSLFQFKRSKDPINKYILLGNIFMALALAAALFIYNIFGSGVNMPTVGAFITPATIIWAVLNFLSLIK